jgi:hypothetical protein
MGVAPAMAAAPETQIDEAPPALLGPGAPTFSFSSPAAAAGFECRLDGAAWEGCASPHGYSLTPPDGLRDGDHLFEVRAVADGDADPDPAAFPFRVDRAHPDTVISSGPDGRTGSRDAAFEFAATEADSRFECRLDAAPDWTPCRSPAAFTGLPPGQHLFSVRATDQAGNSDTTPDQRTFLVDPGGPPVDFASPAAGATVGGSTEWLADVSDAAGVQRVEFLVDGVLRSSDGHAPFAYGGDGRWDTAMEIPGAHILTLRSVGFDGHVENAERTVTVSAFGTPGATLFSGDYESADASQWHVLEAASPERFQAVRWPTSGPHSRYAGRFELRPGDVAAAGTGSGNRAEVYDRSATAATSWKWPDPPGSERYYGWSTYFPEDYPSVNLWQVFKQLHIPGYGASPLAMWVFSDEMQLALRPQGDWSYTQWRGPLERGRWHSFVLRVKWSSNPSVGQFELWVDGELVVAPTNRATSFAYGTTMKAAYLKEGLYRSGRSFEDAAVYHDDMRIATTYEGAAPPAPAIEPRPDDLTPPDSTVVAGPDRLTNETVATFELGASEPGVTFRCRFDQDGPEPCDSSTLFDVDSEGMHRLTVRALDVNGNVDPTPATYEWTVDTVAPTVSITGSPPQTTVSTGARFDLAASEPGVSMDCALDGEPMRPCSSPVTFSGLPAGEHTFRTRGTDGAGNRQSADTEYTWAVGPTPAPARIYSGPGTVTNQTAVTFDFRSSDPDVDFECRVDSLPAGPCTSLWRVAGLADGRHVFYVRTVDRVSRIRSAEVSRAWVVDTVPSDTQITSATTKEVQFTAVPAAAGDRFECRIDTGNWLSCAPPYAIPALPDGVHGIAVRSRDAAGNRDPTPATRTWLLDTVVPETTINSGPSGKVASTSAAFEFSSNESGVKFACSRDNGSWSACTSPVTYSKLNNGTRSFRVRAVDAVGNTDATPAERTWTIDAQGPSTALAEPADGATVGGTIGLSATASDGAGVRSVEFLVDGEVASTDTSTPYVHGTDGRFDTRALAPGTHVIAARATDGLGNGSVRSATVTVDQSAAVSDAVLWDGGFDTGDLSQWSSHSAFAPSRLQVVASLTDGSGPHSARFEAQPGDLVGAELTGDTAAAGSERYYGWSTLLPTGYPAATPYQTLASWHSGDAPVLELRLTGTRLELVARTPAGSLRTLWSASTTVGRWHRFVVRSRWSAAPGGGLVELWYDGKLVYLPAAQQTLLTDAPVALRMGLSRDPAVTGTQVLYHDGVRVGLTYEAAR